MSIQSINPATGQVLETFKETSAAEVERALATAHRAFLAWRDVPFSTRTQLMQKAASLLTVTVKMMASAGRVRTVLQDLPACTTYWWKITTVTKCGAR